MAFVKATKKQSRLRLALIGPSGAGKTFTALRVATGLGGRIAVVDTERGSASKYADRFSFDVMELERFSPKDFVAAIHEAEKAGYDVLVIDSLSHAWMGKGGALEMVDEAAKRSKSGNSFWAWREVTPEHNALVDAMVRSRCHVIATMRSKTEYVIEAGPNGKQTPRKVGLAPVQRDGMEFEFDVVGDMDEASFVVTKTRCPSLAKAVLKEPGEALGQQLREWLTDGAPVPAAPSPAPAADETVGYGYDAEKPIATLPDEALQENLRFLYGKKSSCQNAEMHASLASKIEALKGEIRRRRPAEGKVEARPDVSHRAAAAQGQPKVAFGPHKGRFVWQLTMEELADATAHLKGELDKPESAKWRRKGEAALHDLEAELDVRTNNPPPEEARQ
jgi:hypothetical protein